MAMPQAEKNLRALQQRVRTERFTPDPSRRYAERAIPDVLCSGKENALVLSPGEEQLWLKTQHALRADLRFEHLNEKQNATATWRFICQASVVDRSRDYVSEFVEEHAREPEHRTCFFPIEWLVVSAPIEIFDVRLLPGASAEVPRVPAIPDPGSGPVIASVLAVDAHGTSRELMRDRCRRSAEHALRLLRATVRDDHFVNDRQLRFRLGEVMWFDDLPGGWTSRLDVGWDLELDESLLRVARSAPLAGLSAVPTNDLDRRSLLALEWFERAQLATEPMIELPYLFFALEAILGDTAEKLKAPALALRRAMLGLLTNGSFAHPGRVFVLYDRVRSAAVHGEDAPLVAPDELSKFSWDVRRALNEYLEFARANGFTKRSQVRKALDTHKRREKGSSR